MICQWCSKEFAAIPSAKRKYCSYRCYFAARWKDHRVEHDTPVGLRWCSLCRQNKIPEEFYTQGGAKRGGWCKACRCKNEKARRADVALVRKFHRRYETDMEFRSRELLRAVQKRCRKRSYAYDLDIPWLADRMRAGVCELTGLPFSTAVVDRRPGSHSPSIDRIRPGGGYTKDNCRIVLHAVNVAINAWTIDGFLPIAEALVRRHSKRSVA